MMWSVKCLQGCLRGSQAIYWDEGSVSELRMQEGWVILPVPEQSTVQQYMDATFSLLSPATFHIRLFSRCVDVSGQLEGPLKTRNMICEWSQHKSLGEDLPFACEAYVAAHHQGVGLIR